MTAFGGFRGGEERSLAATFRHHVQAFFGGYPFCRRYRFFSCYRDAIPPRLREPS